MKGRPVEPEAVDRQLRHERFAGERNGSAELVEWVTPSRAEGGAPLQLFAAVLANPFEGEVGKLNDTT